MFREYREGDKGKNINMTEEGSIYVWNWRTDNDHVPDAPKLRASARSLTQPETEKFIRLLYDAGATFAGGRATFPGSGAKRGFWVRVAADFGEKRRRGRARVTRFVPLPVERTRRDRRRSC